LHHITAGLSFPTHVRVRRHFSHRLMAMVFCALASAVTIGAFSAPAAAQWTICNETSYVAEVAIAYSEGERRVTEGWTRVRPGDCQVARRVPLTPGMHYLYARSSTAHRGGLREWSSTIPLCVDARDFSLAGDAACEDLGFETRFFLEVPIDGEVHESSLVEPHLRAVNRATVVERVRISGIQRLLTDNGLYDRVIDGYTGRRTNRAIQAFVASEGLTERPEDFELIDRLEAAALRRSDEVGLKLCNRAEAPVWAAIAMRHDNSWESRGWWSLGPNECAKVIDVALDQPAYYVYAAIQDEDTGEDYPLATAQEGFCLAPTRFAILGRERCVRRGYNEGRFATVLARDRPSATLEFNTSDFESPRSSRRR